MPTLATCLGHARIGVARELKKALEAYWSGKSTSTALHNVGAELRHRHWAGMKRAGIHHIPVGDFSFYDHMLDMAVTVGAVPTRYQRITDSFTRYFAMARGLQDQVEGIDVAALEMTKWFDTNYHYIVPELDADQRFILDASKLLAEIDEAKWLGFETRPVIIGPVTFLLLSKFAPGPKESTSTLPLLERLLPIYKELLEELAARKISWVQLDEPCLTLALDDRAQSAYRQAFSYLSGCTLRPQLLVTTYFGALGDNLPLAMTSGCEGLHVDLVRAPEQLTEVLQVLPASMHLSVGVVDGRNIWRAHLDQAHSLVRRTVEALGADRVLVAPSCSLLHVPVDLEAEHSIDAELKNWLSFGAQKLVELRALAEAADAETPTGPRFGEARYALANRAASTKTRNPVVREQMAAVTGDMLRRTAPFSTRTRLQQRRFRLPTFPTTTIGSFPQTGDVRGARAAWRAGRMTAAEYDAFLKKETRVCIERQEAIGLDVLVHGEFERNDMVEYFGEQLDGFAFTTNGWVQSYGSRCVKPPVIFGDVSRPRPMTVDWSAYAQTLTQRPMKGMLTGPVTILQWSFVRDDQPRRETCLQIALALRDEVTDLEKAGITMIQVDEPAIREGLPLRRQEWPSYLRWAVDAFKLATSGVQNETQIHTHMCYSEFGDILNAIAEMDADVLSIETSRSKMELLVDFAQFRYPNHVGPGVYDIHSPRVPTSKEMVELLTRAREVLPMRQLWVNPDCGLKTRGWPEVEAALENMVEAARVVRQKFVDVDQ
ncbi:MAG: hypothetical protein LZF62_400003 [Nitrospira sp.]|nr:MAG: hypothetical protein LZF62_400003 [Nitrospira sp.]